MKISQLHICMHFIINMTKCEALLKPQSDCWCSIALKTESKRGLWVKEDFRHFHQPSAGKELNLQSCERWVLTFSYHKHARKIHNSSKQILRPCINSCHCFEWTPLPAFLCTALVTETIVTMVEYFLMYLTANVLAIFDYKRQNKNEAQSIIWSQSGSGMRSEYNGYTTTGNKISAQ